jgi:hypothetical protein
MRWILMVLVSSAACGEYCEYSETACDEDGILRCVESDGFADHHFTRSEDACASGEACVDIVDDDGLRRATCSLTGELDPRCPDLRLSRICIDDRTLLVCDYGYSSNLTTCDVACVEPTAAFCALAPTQSPACDVSGGLGCDNVTSEPAILACRKGYEIDRITCASEQMCVEASTPFHRPYCASDEPCEGSNTVCVGRQIEGCVDGRTVSMTCSEGTQCETFGVLGPDNRPTGATEAQCLRR